MVQFKPGLLISSPAGLHHTSRHSGHEGIFSKHFFFVQDEGFEVRTALSLFTVNALCYLPSGDMSNLPQPSCARDHENWTLKNPACQKRSHISLRLCWIPERACALICRRTILMF